MRSAVILARRRFGLVVLFAVWVLMVLLVASIFASRESNEAATTWPKQLAREAPPLARFDSGWYYDIAVQGYKYSREVAQNNVVFFPLEPLAVRWTAELLHTPVLETGVGFSLACLLAAILVLAELFKRWAPPDVSTNAIVLMLAFPTSFFFAAFYSESLFLLLAAGSFLSAEKDSWLTAGILAALASLTRLNGFLLMVPLGFLIAERWRGWRSGGGRVRSLAALGALGFGAALFPLYLWTRFGDPLLFLHATEAGWPQHFTAPWRLAASLAHRIALHQSSRLFLLADLGGLLLFLSLGVYLVWKRRWAAGGYVLANIGLLLCSGTIDAASRYVLVLFPGFFALAVWFRKRKWLLPLYFVVSLTGLFLLLDHFVHWTYVA